MNDGGDDPRAAHELRALLRTGMRSAGIAQEAFDRRFMLLLVGLVLGDHGGEHVAHDLLLAVGPAVDAAQFLVALGIELAAARFENMESKRVARFFEKGAGAQAGNLRVREELRGLITFKQLNLMDPWPMRGPFDAIFCRNVIIYFDKPTQGEVFGRLGRILMPGGYLYIGHSENVGSASAAFRLVGKTIYQARSASEGAKSAA